MSSQEVTTELITRGEMTILQETRVIKRVSTDEFQKQMVGQYIPLYTQHFMPDKVRWNAKFQDKNLYVAVEPPCKRIIKYKLTPNSISAPFKEVELYFPYVIFLMLFQRAAFSRLYFAFAINKPTSLESEIHRPMLPNIYMDLKVCVGNMRFQNAGGLEHKVNQTIDFFWDSMFNADITEQLRAGTPKIIEINSRVESYPAGAPERNLTEAERRLLAWAKMSEGDEPEAAKIPWVKYNTFGNIAGKILGTIL